MKPPRKIVVGPHTYRLRPDTDGVLAGAGRYGQCGHDSLSIDYDARLPHTQLADTILHELIHAALAGTTLADDVEEQVCHCLAPALLHILRGNPALVEWITSE